MKKLFSFCACTKKEDLAIKDRMDQEMLKEDFNTPGYIPSATGGFQKEPQDQSRLGKSMELISTVVDRTADNVDNHSKTNSFISSPGIFPTQLQDPPDNESIELRACVKLVDYLLSDGSVYSGEMKKVDNSKYLFKRHGEGLNNYFPGNR